MSDPEATQTTPPRQRHPLLSNWMIAALIALVLGPVLLLGIHRNWGTLLLDFGIVTVLLCVASWLAPETRQRGRGA